MYSEHSFHITYRHAGTMVKLISCILIDLQILYKTYSQCLNESFNEGMNISIICNNKHFMSIIFYEVFVFNVTVSWGSTFMKFN